MKYISICFLYVSCLICSCTGFKTTATTKITNTAGRQLVENSGVNVSILYYGDYWFHSLNSKNTLNYDQEFVKSIKNSPGKKMLLFAAHTTIEPYCTSAGLLYKECNLSTTIESISTQLKGKLAENLKVAEGNTSTKSYSTLSYELQSSKLRIHYSYLEYYFTKGNNVIRIIFWTSDSNKNWLKSESEAIVETLKWED